MERRRPSPALLPFVAQFWASSDALRHAAGTTHERVLPSGAMHLVLRLGPAPLQIFEADSFTPETSIKGSVVGGIRSCAYFKDVSTPVASVGVVLKPGAAQALFGVPSNELAETHTGLDTLWGPRASRLTDKLASLPSLTARIDCLERSLIAMFPSVRGIHPGVARVLDDSQWATGRASALAARAGLGQRRFARLFRETVGISPKRWLRLLRFRNAVERAGDHQVDWAELAYSLGYSDQPHLAREFREFSGLTPSQYRRLAPISPSHVPHHSTSPFSSRQR